MLAQGGTPRGWHSKWVANCKLTPTDSLVSVHENMCHILEMLVCYDQINVATLGGAEIVARQLQAAEEKWKERVVGLPNEVTHNTAFLFSGQQTRGNLCICPALTEWITEEM
eukprot:11932778-Karenia_brevis.AAC.1